MENGRMASSLDGTDFPEVYWDNPVHYLQPFLWPEVGFRDSAANREVLAPGVAVVGDTALSPERLYVVIQEEGSAQVALGLWEAMLRPGDVALYVGEDLPLAAPGHGRQVAMNFPLLGLSVAQRDVIQLLPVVLPAGHPSTALLGRMADNLNEAKDYLSPTLATLFLGSLLSTLAGTLACRGNTALEALPRLARFHLQRIKTYLRQHMREPGLSLKTAALALGLSVSHLHRVFSRDGCTVSEWLWNERLEGAAADLHNLSEAHRSVGDIALAWGFNDLSHFSRAFKKRFHMAPKAWRSQAQLRQAEGA